MDIESFDECQISGKLLTSPRSLRAMRRLGYNEEQLLYKPWAWFTKRSDSHEEAALRRENWEIYRNRAIAEVRHARQVLIQHEAAAPTSVSPKSSVSEKTRPANMTRPGKVAPLKKRKEKDLERRDLLLQHIEQKNNVADRLIAERSRARCMDTSKRLQKWLQKRERAADLHQQEELATVRKYAATRTLRHETAERVVAARAQWAVNKRSRQAEKLQETRQREATIKEADYLRNQATCKKVLERNNEIERKQRELQLARGLLKADTEWVASMILKQKQDNEAYERKQREQTALKKHEKSEKCRMEIEEEKKVMSLYRHLVKIERDEKRKEVRLFALEEEREKIEKREKQQDGYATVLADERKTARLRNLNKELRQLDRIKEVERAKRKREFMLLERMENNDNGGKYQLMQPSGPQTESSAICAILGQLEDVKAGREAAEKKVAATLKDLKAQREVNHTLQQQHALHNSERARLQQAVDSLTQQLEKYRMEVELLRTQTLDLKQQRIVPLQASCSPERLEEQQNIVTEQQPKPRTRCARCVEAKETINNFLSEVASVKEVTRELQTSLAAEKEKYEAFKMSKIQEGKAIGKDLLLEKTKVLTLQHSLHTCSTEMQSLKSQYHSEISLQKVKTESSDMKVLQLEAANSELETCLAQKSRQQATRGTQTPVLNETVVADLQHELHKVRELNSSLQNESKALLRENECLAASNEQAIAFTEQLTEVKSRQEEHKKLLKKTTAKLVNSEDKVAELSSLNAMLEEECGKQIKALHEMTNVCDAERLASQQLRAENKKLKQQPTTHEVSLQTTLETQEEAVAKQDKRRLCQANEMLESELHQAELKIEDLTEDCNLMNWNITELNLAIETLETRGAVNELELTQTKQSFSVAEQEALSEREQKEEVLSQMLTEREETVVMIDTYRGCIEALAQERQTKETRGCFQQIRVGDHFVTDRAAKNKGGWAVYYATVSEILDGTVRFLQLDSPFSTDELTRLMDTERLYYEGQLSKGEFEDWRASWRAQETKASVTASQVAEHILHLKDNKSRGDPRH